MCGPTQECFLLSRFRVDSLETPLCLPDALVSWGQNHTRTRKALWDLGVSGGSHGHAAGAEVFGRMVVGSDLCRYGTGI